MFISAAYAATDAVSPMATGGASAWEAFALNMLLIVILVILFYVLLILPQQKRFKKHREMIDALKKGDEVITAGGLVGKVHKVLTEENQVVVDLGEGVKVTALRSTIQNKKSN